MTFVQEILKVIQNAKDGISSLESVITSDIFIETLDTLYYTKGKIILSGVGKSSFIGKKIAASLSSIGKQAIFLDPTNASHGDLGLISKDDSIILLSKSGASIELQDTIKYSQNLNIPIISVTMNKNSFLAKESTIAIILEDIKDGFSGLNNIPMSSMTTFLTLGDCICTGVAIKIGVNKEKYGMFHPGGKIGRSLTKIKYIMRSEERIPLVCENETMENIIIEMNSKMLGITGVGDVNGLLGIITDGDLRRHISDFHNKKKCAKDIMTLNFKYITSEMYLDDAIDFLTKNNITSSLILNEDNKVVGAINIHDLLK